MPSRLATTAMWSASWPWRRAATVAERDADADREDDREEASARAWPGSGGRTPRARAGRSAIEVPKSPCSSWPSHVKYCTIERLVEAVQLVDPLDGLGVARSPSRATAGPPGQGADPEEEQDGQAEQRRDEQEQPACRWCVARGISGGRRPGGRGRAGRGDRMPRPARSARDGASDHERHSLSSTMLYTSSCTGLAG